MLKQLHPRVLFRNHNFLFGIIVLIVSFGLFAMPDLFESPFAQYADRVQARVLSVDDSLIQQFGIVKAGSQSLDVEIIDGPYDGQTVEATNTLLGKMETDKMFMVGDTVLLVVDAVEDGQVTAATAYDHYRLNLEVLLVVVFALLLVGFAGWGGVRAILSFGFALLLMWKILLPGILKGWDPVYLAFVVVLLLAAVTLFLVAGVTRVAAVALIGALLGILLTIAVSLVLLPPFRLHGAVQPFSETLLYSGFEYLNLTRLFLAAIFIGASGAVVDIAIDVSTAMSEVIAKRHDLTRRELYGSGLVVGRNMTSTMVTTLLMAYISGYMALLMVFIAQGVPPAYLLNTNYLAAEILKTVVGSLGLVAVAPFTALVGSIIFLYRRAAPSEDPIPTGVTLPTLHN